jgi:hypothetical protein
MEFSCPTGSPNLTSPENHVLFMTKEEEVCRYAPVNIGSYKFFKPDYILMFAVIVILAAGSSSSFAFPAFARKYSLPCSVCHEAWPKLNSFGQNFKDNGYQLMNDRDSPIYMNLTYWPVSMRTVPNWHAESNGNVPVDTPSGPVEQTVKTSGFDLTGVDILAGGTLAKNVSFLLVSAIDSEEESIGVEAANVRFDNIKETTWINFKFGKAELDLPLSEKRIMTLSNTGGFYELYHYLPVGDVTVSNPADNQLGAELMGHSLNDHTRYAFSVVSSNDGTPGLPAGRSYDIYFHLSQGFNAGNLGLQRVGVYTYYGWQPTFFLTSEGEDIPGTGKGNEPFYRLGFYGNLSVGRFDLTGVYQHASDNVFLATGTPNDGTLLPPGAQDSTWNTGTFEAHFTYSPRLLFLGRYELVRMSQQALPEFPSELGNINVFTVACRYYPIMNSRAGLAWHTEYSTSESKLTSPNGQNQRNSSFFTGLDFAF